MNVKLLKSEFKRVDSTFVLNELRHKIKYLENELLEMENVENSFMNLLINISCQDRGAEIIVYETDIITLFTEGYKTFNNKLFLWFVANICVTSQEIFLYMIDTYEIFNIITNKDYYEIYDPDVLWAFKNMSTIDIGQDYATQLLYIILQMEEGVIHHYISVLYHICKKYPNITETFILENGLYLIYNNFEINVMCRSFLLHIFSHNKNSDVFIKMLYDFFSTLLETYLLNNNNMEIMGIYSICLEYVKIDLDLEYLIDELNSNLDYYVLDLLGKKNITLNREQHLRVFNYIKDDEPDYLTIGFYCDYLLNVGNLNDFDYPIIKNSLKFLDRVYINGIEVDRWRRLHNNLDNTLFKKCKTRCIELDLEFPHFISI